VIGTVAAKAANPEEKLQALIARVNEVSTIPAVALKIMEVINDAKISAADLKEIVEHDPSLTARVLRTVNSAYFSLRNPIGSLQHAISMLGFNAIRNLAVTASVCEVFKRESTAENYSRIDLWRHMLSVALSARMIARRIGHAQFEDAYLAGLLHDIGVVLLDEHAHREFCAVLKTVTPDRELQWCERSVLGFDHAEFGAAIAHLWRLPEVVAERIRYHHVPQNARKDDRVMVSTVALADFLCARKGAGAVRVTYTRKLESHILADLQLSREDLRVMWEDIDRELSAAASLFRL
jgi:putative nucleotidyltransferase with HDIG domain